MFLSNKNADQLKITVDSSRIKSSQCSPCVENGIEIFCQCKTEICQCGSRLAVSETAAKQIYDHLGFVDGRDMMVTEGYRMDSLNIWGTHELSTSDLLSWLKQFNPKGVEWIDDSSCNILLSNENMVLQVLTKLTEPFDARVALAAMAAVVSTMERQPAANNQDLSIPGSEAPIPSAEDLFPPKGRWFKSISSPNGAFCLYLRIAHKGDVKLPGAERRSHYYRRHGNPNYGGAVGLLSRSYRRRVKDVTNPSADIRTVNAPANETRGLVTYEDMDDDVHGIFHRLGQRVLMASDVGAAPSVHLLPSGRRREAIASGLSRPPRNPPSKWPRTTFSADDASHDDDVFHPPPLSQAALSFDFSGNGATDKRRVGVKARLGTRQAPLQQPALATVTILPDTFGDEDFMSVQMLTSMRMVADIEEEEAVAHQHRHRQKQENVFNSPSARRAPVQVPRRRHRRDSPFGGSRDVWDRLG